MTPTVRASALASFVEVAQALNLNPFALLRRVEIDPRALTHPDTRLKAKDFGALLELAAHESGCDTFGLRMAELRRLSDFGALSLLLAHQPTLRAVLATVVRYGDVINETLSLSVEEAGDVVIVREELPGAGTGGARQAHELTVGVMIRILQSLVGGRWRPISVNFAHAPPASLETHRRLLGDGVAFNSAFNGFCCRTADLERPNPKADPFLAQYAELLVRGVATSASAALENDVRRSIQQLLPAGRATLESVAARMGLGARTLQRRLDERGLGFRGLVEEVRSDLARRYVEDTRLTMTESASLLGFSHAAAFTRWFHHRFGAPPSKRRSGRS